MLSIPDGNIRYLMGGYNERHDIALGDLHEIPFPIMPVPAVRMLLLFCRLFCIRMLALGLRQTGGSTLMLQ